MADQTTDPYGEFSTAAPGQAPAQSDPYAEFSSAAPDYLSEAGAAAEAGGKALLETGGAMAGAATGMGLGALTGPFAPVAVPVGGLAGLAVGYFAGRHASQGAGELIGQPNGLRSPEEMPPELRPAGYLGEAVGGTIPFTGGLITLGKLGFSTGRAFIDRILQHAAAHPLKFALGETGGSLYAGYGGKLAEENRPGEVLPRVAAETAGGFLNPTGRILSAFSNVPSLIRRAVSQFSPGAAETIAGQYLQHIVTEFGDDPENVAALLSEPSLLQGVTSAQKTGSDALIALEQKLARDSTKFGQFVSQSADRAMKAAGNIVDLLRGTGDPAALESAAEAQSNRFKGLISARITQAERDATAAAANITPDTPQARQKISQTAVQIVGDALKDARGVERSLWDKVSTDVPSDGQNVLGAVAELRDRLLPEESLPPIVEGFAKRLQGEGPQTPEDARAAAEALFSGAPAAEVTAPTTTGELKILRSRMLQLAQEASAQHRYGEASAYGKVAEAALEDLTQAFQGSGDTSFEDARTFSRELHQTFTQTFADNATATTRLGAERVPPEVFLQRALGGGGDLGDVRLQDLQKAAAFPAGEAGDIAQRTERMALAQERILRLAASDAINPETGVVNTRKLSGFLEKNADLLDNFPAARDDIEKAITSQQGAANLRGVLENGQRVADRQAAFAKVLKVDSPVDAVRKAIGSATPQTQLTGLFKVAARGGPAAQEGLKSSIWEDAINKATRNDAIDFGRLDKALSQPIRPGLPSVMDMMQQNGLVGSAERAILNRVIKEGRNVAKASDPGALLRGADATPNMALDTLLRIAGSKAGGAVSKMMGGGSTLIANSVGARYLTQVFERMGVKNTMALVMQAAKDPATMAMLLRKPQTEQEGLKLAQRIHAYAIAAGLAGAQSQPPKDQQRE